jgi:tRNA(Arg) A34 adenosine deaminase TadA
MYCKTDYILCTMKISKYIHQLIQNAQLSTLKFKHSAMIVSGGKCIAVAHNADRTYIRGKIYSGLHAEHAVINRIRRTVGCTLIVIRVSKTGLLGESLPCAECVTLIRIAGIKKIYYSTERDFKFVRVKNLYSTHISHAQRKYACY